MPEGQGVGRRRKRAKPTSGATRHLLPEEGGRMPPFLHRHFERKREIFFVRGQAKVVREAGNGKHRMLHVTGDHGASCRWIYEGKQQTANEKDPSAALGMTKRGNASRPFLFNPEQKPISAPSGHLLPKEGGSIHASPFPWKGLLSAARRGWLPFWAVDRVLSYIAYLRRSPSLSFIPLEPYPPLQGTFSAREG